MTVSEISKQDLATLEFTAVVHDIFLTIFMNKNIKLTEKNMDEAENFVKHRLEVLGTWKRSVLTLRRDDGSEWPYAANNIKKTNKHLSHNLDSNHLYDL